jgi:hypothetical protein
MYLLHNQDNGVPIMVLGLKEIIVRALQNKRKACMNTQTNVKAMGMASTNHGTFSASTRGYLSFKPTVRVADTYAFLQTVAGGG